MSAADTRVLADDLAAAWPGRVRRATPDDAVAGVLPTVVVEPESVDEVAGVLRATTAAGGALCVVGSRTAVDSGPPPRALDVVLSTVRLAGVREHNPGDLVVRAGAGTRLSSLQAELAAHGQLLALDPPDGEATLGGIVAANASGPLRHRYGTVRDLLIGVTFVLADGTVAKSGGKVVKNVAGYDLGKLFTGSYGTLAVLVDLTFRLHPRPAETVWIHSDVSDPTTLAALLAAYRSAPTEPSALELDVDLATGAGSLCAAFDGTSQVAHAQADRMLAMVAASVVPAPVLAPPVPGSTEIRLAVAPARVPDALGLVAQLPEVVAHGGRLSGRAGLGVLSVSVPVPDASGCVALVEGLRGIAARFDGSAVVTRVPDSARLRVDHWGPVRGLDLMRRVKDTFDPDGTLAPGRFVGGI